VLFFFKQKTAYEIGLGIPAEPLFRSQTACQYFTNDQIKEMTRKVSAEVDLVHQQTQNQRYGSSHIGATAKDISNVVTGSAGMPRSEERRVGKECRSGWSAYQEKKKRE